MSDILHSFTHSDLTVNILADYDCGQDYDPRDQDPDSRLVRIACRDDSRSHTFGDDDAQLDIEAIVGDAIDKYDALVEDAVEGEDLPVDPRTLPWPAILRQHILDEFDAIPETIVGLACTDHSGLSLRVDVADGSNCGDRWDTAFIGWAFATRQGQVNTGAPDEGLREQVLAEAKEYGYWLAGEVYGYEILTPEGDQVDACFGYLGWTHVESEAKAAATASAKWLHDQAVAKATAVREAIEADLAQAYPATAA